jgi:nitrous oxidase accessory protein NosD
MSINANSGTITVPDDYLTIQEAINAANVGDTVYVRSGIYKENLTINKGLRLIGENRMTTVIDGEYRQAKNIFINQTHDVEISGFTVRNVSMAENIDIEQSNDVFIHDSIICHTQACNIAAWGSTHIEISNSMMFDSYCCMSLIHINHCLIENNEIFNHTMCCISFLGDDNIIRNNTLNGNYKYDKYGWWGWMTNGIDVAGSNNTIINNTIYHCWDAMHIGAGQYGTDNKIIGNKMIGDRQSVYGNGIRFSDTAANVTIVGNTFNDYRNGCYALYILTAGNSLYYNNFVDTWAIRWPITGPTNNTWDYEGRGNYWWGYDGEDLNGDGVGDTKLPVAEVDWHPLMNPYNTTLTLPTAVIDSISPSPACEFEEVSFEGHGVSYDDLIIDYAWYTNASEMLLSEEPAFKASSLEIGIHEITFRVRSDEGIWGETKVILTVSTGVIIQVKELKYNKWNLLTNPFQSLDGARDYIETRPKSPQDFGSISINVTLENVGVNIAGILIDAYVSMDVSMVYWDPVNTTNDILVYPQQYYYSETLFIGTIEKNSSAEIPLTVPIKYSCVIAGQVSLEDPDFGDMVELNVTILIVSVKISLRFRGNFEEITYALPEDLMGISDPEDLLKTWNTQLSERVQEKMIRYFLEKYYTEVANITPFTKTIIDIPTGREFIEQFIILPDVKKFVASLVVPIGVTLLEFFVLPSTMIRIDCRFVTNDFAEILLDQPLPGIAYLHVKTASPPINMTVQISQLLPANVTTISHRIYVIGETFYVTTTSNSTISNVLFSKEDKQISFNATGPEDSEGFCLIEIPIRLLDGNFTVWVNGTKSEITLSNNETHTMICITYSHSVKIEIDGTTVIPEFRGFMIPLFMIVASIAVLMYGLKKRKRPTPHFFSILHLMYIY